MSPGLEYLASVVRCSESMSRSKIPALVLALLLLVTLAPGCRSAGPGAEGEGRQGRAFSKVRPPVAFEMLRDNPGIAVVDLRPRFEFTGPVGHVRGARNVPLDELPERLDELSPLKERTFLVYCGHDGCGEEGVEILLEAGYREAILMDGGIDAWVMDGFGTVTGPSPPIHFPEADSDEIVVD